MTITSGAITAPPYAINMPYSFANEQRFASAAGVIPISMSRDRSVIFGAVRNGGAVGLYTINDTTGATTLLHSFGDRVYALVETYDGEALCINGNLSGVGAVYRSSGWSTSKTAATWTSVLTLSGGIPLSDYSGNRWSMGTNGVMVVAEQGSQTVATTSTGDVTADNATAVTNNAAKAHRAYVTVNNGATWTLLYDQLLQSPNLQPWQISGSHLHGFEYDEEWDRMWASFGDNTGQGPNLYGTSKMQIIYSDDWRNVLTGGTATWNTLNLPTDWPSTTATDATQVVGMLITSKAIILGADSIPYGIMVIPRTGYRQIGNVRWSCMYPMTAGTQLIGKDIAWAGTGYPIIASFSINNSTAPGLAYLPHLYASADEGLNWFEIWKDPVRRRRTGDRVSAFGPTINNKMIAATQDTGNGASANGYTITWDLVKAA